MIAYRVYEINDIYMAHVQRRHNGRNHGWIYCTNHIADYDLAKRFAELYIMCYDRYAGIDKIEVDAIDKKEIQSEEKYLKKQIKEMWKILKERAK
jgi:hypothetical protein